MLSLMFGVWVRCCATQILLISTLALVFVANCFAQSSTPLTNFPTFSGGFGYIYAIAISGSTIYVGGDFTSATNAPVNGGTTVVRNRIAAIDAATGAILPWNPNANNPVRTIAVSGSTVYAGGDFTTIGGSVRNRIAALDAATGTATAWDPNANSLVLALAVSGSTIYAGGQFTTIGGNTRNRIAALDAATGRATAWDPDAKGIIDALAVSGSNIYAAGNFVSIRDEGRKCFAAFGLSSITSVRPIAVIAGKQQQSASQELSIYPNPMETELRISGVGQRTVRVYDMRGSVVLEERTVSGVVNVSSLPPGAYTVVVGAADGQIVRQRVVKK